MHVCEIWVVARPRAIDTSGWSLDVARGMWSDMGRPKCGKPRTFTVGRDELEEPGES